MAKIIKEFKPDVAHFNNIYPLITSTAYHVCKKYNIPIIQHIHNYRFMCPKGILFRAGKICELCLHKRFPFYSIFFGCYHQSRFASLFFSLAFYYHNLVGTFKLIDKFIFPSEFTRNYYLNNLGIPRKKTITIPYFVEFEEKKFLKIKKRDYFLFVGRLSEEKGIIQLLEVFKTLPKLKLIVIGNGPLRKEVEKYKKYSNITILGFLLRDKISKYIREARTIIISSIWYEVLPLVVLETISKNTPVLIPNNQNFESISKKNKLILSYKFADFNDLKKKIIELNKKTTSAKETQNSLTPKYHYQALIDEYLGSI